MEYYLKIHSKRERENLVYNHTEIFEDVEYHDIKPQTEISVQWHIKVRILDLLYGNGKYSGVTLETVWPSRNSLVVNRDERRLLLGETASASMSCGNDDFDVVESCEISIVTEKVEV